MDSGAVIFLHVGKGGVQFGSALWEMLYLEHGISKDGKFERHNVFSEPSGPLSPINEKLNTFFMEGSQGRQIPRALFLDLDPGSMEDIRNNHRMLNGSQLIHWKEDSASNYARGYYSKGQDLLENAMRKIQSLVEGSAKLQGFVISRTLGGGTGSGFGSLLLQNLREVYPKAAKVSVDIIPTVKLSSTVLEPYNVLLATHASMEYADVTFLFENEALMELCQHHLGIKEPKVQNLNNLMAQIMSAVTSCVHSEGNLNRSLAEMKANLVPYSRLHFPLISFAPISPPAAAHKIKHFDNLLMEVFSEKNQVIKTDPKAEERNMAINFLYRGHMTTVDANSIHETLVENSKEYGAKLKFVDWVPKAMKAGVCPVRSVYLPKVEGHVGTNALLLMKNTTAVSGAFKKMVHRFEPLFARKSFIHWYLQEGMQESEFSEAQQDILGLVREYKECARGANVSGTSSKISTRRLESSPKSDGSVKSFYGGW